MSRSVFERVLITGGTGFIGRYLLERLISEGVRPLVTTRNAHHSFSDKVDIVELDLTDTRRTLELVLSSRPQAVIHLAGVTGSEDREGEQRHDANVVATNGLLAALDGIGCERVVMIGSASEYGSQSTPFSEDMATIPVSPYGASKAECTRIAMDMYRTKGLPVTVLRVFSAYGHGQPKQMFLPQLISHALQGSRFEMSDGTQRRDFVHVDDVAEAIRLALYASDSVGRIINIGSGRSYALADVARTVWRKCGADPNLLAVGVRGKTGDDHADTQADITLAEQTLGWRPQTPFFDTSEDEGGLSRMIRQMKFDIVSSTTATRSPQSSSCDPSHQ